MHLLRDREFPDQSSWRGNIIRCGWSAATLLLAACGTLKPVADTTRFYTLAPATPAAGAAVAATAEPPARRIGVRVTVQADYLRRPEIAVRTSANELRLDNDHRWAERIDEGVARVLALGLQHRLPDASVAPVAGGAAAGSRTIVDATIVACEGTADGATLEGYWRIKGLPGQDPALSGHFRRVVSGWNGTDYGQLAGLLGGLVDDLAAEITAGIPTEEHPQAR